MSATLYAYAFFPVPPAEMVDVLEQTEGLSDSIQVIVAKGSSIAAAVEPLADLKVLESSDEVLLRSALRHDQVICHLFSQLQVLPLRFGTCFVSREKLQDHLLAKQADYQQTLAAITGLAEYMLKAYALPQPVAEESLQQGSLTGTAYLLAKKQEYLRQQQIQTQLEVELTSLQQLWPSTWPQRSIDSQGEEQLRIYFLLSPEHYQQALRLTEEWLQHHPYWRLEWSTALPPYHFVQSPSLS
jgi:hypothetical protein